jgi:hypothetical protein
MKTNYRSYYIVFLGLAALVIAATGFSSSDKQENLIQKAANQTHAGTFRDRNISRGLFLVYGTPL